jgi:type I restriction enzyme S subunit
VTSNVIDYRGKTPKKLGGDWSNSGYRALSAKNIKTGKIVQPDSIRYVSEEMYKSWMKEEVQKEDILITSEAPFGQIYYWNSDEKIVLSQRLFAVRVNAQFYPKYIYFYMTSPLFQKELDGRATGTTVVGLRQPELLKCKILAPEYYEQKKIADTLWCLEQKININEAINNNFAPPPCKARIAAKQRRQISKLVVCLHTSGEMSVRGANEETAEQFSSLTAA